MTRRFFLFLIAALAASACTQTPMLPDDLPYDISPANDGLRISNSDLRIDFGRAEAGAVAAVEKLLAASPVARNTNTECGAGPVTGVRWKEGLDLQFQNGSFRGWSAESAVFVSASGFSTGMTRDQLVKAGVTGFEATTLGTEAEVSDGIFVLLDGSGAGATVVMMWAGVSCFFR